MGDKNQLDSLIQELEEETKILEESEFPDEINVEKVEKLTEGILGGIFIFLKKLIN